MSQDNQGSIFMQSHILHQDNEEKKSSEAAQHESASDTVTQARLTPQLDQPNLNPNRILHLQRTLGNQAVMRLLNVPSKSAVQRHGPDPVPQRSPRFVHPQSVMWGGRTGTSYTLDFDDTNLVTWGLADGLFGHAQTRFGMQIGSLYTYYVVTWAFHMTEEGLRVVEEGRVERTQGEADPPNVEVSAYNRGEVLGVTITIRDESFGSVHLLETRVVSPDELQEEDNAIDESDGS